MRPVLFILILFFSLQGCNNHNDSFPIEEQCNLLSFVIKSEEDSSWAMITRAKHGFYYMVKDQFHDSIFFDNSDLRLIDKNINPSEIQRQYKKALKRNDEVVCDSFDLVRIIEFSNKSPESLSFSKPIKYLKYYFINFSYNSWSSGYSTFLVLEKIDLDNYNILCRRVYRVT